MKSRSQILFHLYHMLKTSMDEKTHEEFTRDAMLDAVCMAGYELDCRIRVFWHPYEERVNNMIRLLRRIGMDIESCDKPLGRLKEEVREVMRHISALACTLRVEEILEESNGGTKKVRRACAFLLNPPEEDNQPQTKERSQAEPDPERDIRHQQVKTRIMIMSMHIDNGLNALERELVEFLADRK